jgi:hypothetical protein
MKGPFFAERDIVLSSDFLCCDAGYDESLCLRDLVLPFTAELLDRKTKSIY